MRWKWRLVYWYVLFVGSFKAEHLLIDLFDKYQMATAPPLCLDPNPHLTRIANNILRVSVPTTPASLKRKAAAMEMEEEDAERARRAKIMQFMNPKINRSTAPRYFWITYSRIILF